MRNWKMGIKHWSHQHEDLQFHDESADTEHQPEICNGCGKQLEGTPRYVCHKFRCSFGLHETCFRSSYPEQVLPHPDLHAHPLLLLSGYPARSLYNGYVCNGCNRLSYGFVYRCGECDFNLDVQCALLMQEEIQSHSREEAAKQPTRSLQHFSHPNHHLTFFTSSTRKINCKACGGEIAGGGYVCCDCGVGIHESCSELTLEIQQHPYHPHHPLNASSKLKLFEMYTVISADRLSPQPMSFILAPFAASVSISSVLKGIFPLLLPNSDATSTLYITLKRSACNADCERSYYRCLECNYHIHLGCTGLPDTVDHCDHLHPLTLKDTFVEDDSGQRNGDYPVYHCKQCPDAAPFAAHIECVVSQEDTWVNSDLVADDDCGEETMNKYSMLVELDEIKDFDNNHDLVIHHDGDVSRSKCDGCKERIDISGRSSYYSCSFCNSHYHKLCAELSLKIRHSLHSLHPLTITPPKLCNPILCVGCLHVSFDGGYKCGDCKFELDLKCASSLTVDQFRNSQSKKDTIIRSLHDHKLTPFTYSEATILPCHACFLPIFKTAYGCVICCKFFHETCSEIPRHRQYQ
ncbi:hypothetical protein Tsubulata_047999 [Turnera subulata]|uniref:DC1 domain-containing protein n=1 Tax=Turnera subulata TaxID=218843 RepID=A0A9Q0G5N7_9ROSI|nr:hypothetical protein Tsubulata_047999 [Turnera subulata]